MVQEKRKCVSMHVMGCVCMRVRVYERVCGVCVWRQKEKARNKLGVTNH